MKKIKISFILLMVLPSLLWLFTDRTTWSDLLADTQLMRSALLQYSGVMAISALSLAMLLATRPLWLEPYLGGLDKMYRLHKWLGVSSLLFAVGHWFVYGALTQQEHKLGGVKAIRLAWEALNSASWKELKADPLGFFMGQYDLALGLGDWVFKLLVILCALALIKRFPYRHFFKTHILLAPSYLALAFHSVVLMDSRYWKGPLGWGMALLLCVGSASAVLLLFRHWRGPRGTPGEVVSIIRHDALETVTLVIQCTSNWKGHQAGQFAFLTRNGQEGHHPFTLTSAWAGNNQLEFTVKARGQYTRRLAETLQIGDKVTVEGPYGCFTFQSKTRRQIWVGGGIGITPFMARMKALAQSPDGKSIDLFHATSIYDPLFIDPIEQDAKRAEVRLHVFCDKRDGLLDATQIVRQVPEWRTADVWFCGPAQFGRALRKNLTAMGLPKAHFHQELFEMR